MSSANWHWFNRALGKCLVSISFSVGLDYVKLIVYNYMEMIMNISIRESTELSS